MLKEHDIKSLEETDLNLIKDDVLTRYVIEGAGGVTIAEVLTLALMDRDKVVPQNVAEAALKNITGEIQRNALTVSINNWNKNINVEKMKLFMRTITYPTATSAIAIANAYNWEDIQYRDLKLQNLQTALDVISREFGAF